MQQILAGICKLLRIIIIVSITEVDGTTLLSTQSCIRDLCVFISFTGEFPTMDELSDLIVHVRSSLNITKRMVFFGTLFITDCFSLLLVIRTRY